MAEISVSPAHLPLVRPARGARGAALVEFALLLPVLFMLVFGMMTGAVVYDHNLTISYAAQQTARFGATLPVGVARDEVDRAVLEDWLETVHDRVVLAGNGTLDEGQPGRRVCVAHVDPDGLSLSRTVTTDDGAPTWGTQCYDDGIDAVISGSALEDVEAERRIQIDVARDDQIDLVLFGTIHVDLAKQAVARFEAEEPT